MLLSPGLPWVRIGLVAILSLAQLNQLRCHLGRRLALFWTHSVEFGH